jgi:hypothetical protein
LSLPTVFYHSRNGRPKDGECVYVSTNKREKEREERESESEWFVSFDVEFVWVNVTGFWTVNVGVLPRRERRESETKGRGERDEKKRERERERERWEGGMHFRRKRLPVKRRA